MAKLKPRKIIKEIAEGGSKGGTKRINNAVLSNRNVASGDTLLSDLVGKKDIIVDGDAIAKNMNARRTINADTLISDIADIGELPIDGDLFTKNSYIEAARKFNKSFEAKDQLANNVGGGNPKVSNYISENRQRYRNARNSAGENRIRRYEPGKPQAATPIAADSPKPTSVPKATDTANTPKAVNNAEVSKEQKELMKKFYDKEGLKQKLKLQQEQEGNPSNWVYKTAAIGVSGGLVLNMAGSRGQQSNAELYGQY